MNDSFLDALASTFPEAAGRTRDFLRLKCCVEEGAVFWGRHTDGVREVCDEYSVVLEVLLA